MSAKQPKTYSIKESTVENRTRRNKLTGVDKVRHFGKAADYRAVARARKDLLKKSEFAQASEAQQKEMIKASMEETMHKRREKGQDTMSKVNEYNKMEEAKKSGTPSPVKSNGHVSMSEFCQDKGYFPLYGARAAKAASKDAPVVSENGNMQSPSGIDPIAIRGKEENAASGEVSMDDGMADAEATLMQMDVENNYQQKHIKASSSPDPMVPQPDNAMLSVEGHGTGDDDDDLGQTDLQLHADSPTPPDRDASMADVLPSIERDGSQGEVDALSHEVATLRREADEMRATMQKLNQTIERQARNEHKLKKMCDLLSNHIGVQKEFQTAFETLTRE